MKKLLLLAVFVVTCSGCVSMKKYRRDVDDAEIYGEAKTITTCIGYTGEGLTKEDTIWLLKADISLLKMRRINQVLGLYGFPPRNTNTEEEVR